MTSPPNLPPPSSGNDRLQKLIPTVLQCYPDLQALYLFGSFDTEVEWESSDIDIALLLPHQQAKEAGSLGMSELRFILESLFNKDVDLINLRQSPTVLQNEIVFANRRIFCADLVGADEFEMYTLSLYQKLNQERAELLAEGLRSGRFYDV